MDLSKTFFFFVCTYQNLRVAPHRPHLQLEPVGTRSERSRTVILRDMTVHLDTATKLKENYLYCSTYIVHGTLNATNRNFTVRNWLSWASSGFIMNFIISWLSYIGPVWLFEYYGFKRLSGVANVYHFVAVVRGCLPSVSRCPSTTLNVNWSSRRRHCTVSTQAILSSPQHHQPKRLRHY